jgi:hypothetical protein
MARYPWGTSLGQMRWLPKNAIPGTPRAVFLSRRRRLSERSSLLTLKRVSLFDFSLVLRPKTLASAWTVAIRGAVQTINYSNTQIK